MKITKIKIENYKSIKDAMFDLRNNTVLVGPNDHGKTNVLNAIHDVFNLPIDENNKIYDNDFYKKNKRWGAGASAPVRISFFVESLPKGLWHTKRKIKQYGLAIRFMANGEVRCSMVNSNLDNPKLNNSEVNFQRYLKIRELLNVIYVPTFRNIEEHLSGSSDRAALYSLISKMLFLDITTSRQQGGNTSTYKSIKDLKIQTDKMVSGAFKDKKKSISKYLPSNTNIELEFGFIAKDGEQGERLFSDIVSKDVIIRNKETGALITELGSGIQQAVTIGLLEDVLIEKGKTNILLFEEPESFLHPNAQRELYLRINQLSKKPNNQIVFTTHSSSVVDATNMEDVVVVRKDYSTSITDIYSYNKNQNFGAVEYARLVLEKTFRNSDLFFSEAVVLVEGPTDKIVLEEVLTRLKPEWVHRVAIVDVGGVNSFKLTASFLDSYSSMSVRTQAFKWLIIADKDIMNSNRPFILEKIPSLKNKKWNLVEKHFNTKVPTLNNVINQNTARLISNRINKEFTENNVFILESDMEYLISKLDTVMKIRNILKILIPSSANTLSGITSQQDLAEELGSKGPNLDWANHKRYKKPFIAKALCTLLTTNHTCDEINKILKIIDKNLS